MQPIPRSVSFQTVHIYEHPMILGDNPGGAFGPPLTIDWEAQASYEFPLDEYEAKKPPGRGKIEYALPASIRVEILRRYGYSRNEIVQLTKPVNQARARRRATAQSLRLAGVEAFVETVVRGSRHVITFGRLKRRERKYLESCCSVDEGPTKPGDLQDSFPTAAFTEEEISSGDDADGPELLEI